MITITISQNHIPEGDYELEDIRWDSDDNRFYSDSGIILDELIGSGIANSNNIAILIIPLPDGNWYHVDDFFEYPNKHHKIFYDLVMLSGLEPWRAIEVLAL